MTRTPDPSDGGPGDCPLCGRPLLHASRHHLTPRSRGGTEIALICRDCHSAIHALMGNRALENGYDSIDALAAEPRLAKAFAFIARQDPGRRLRTRRARERPER